MPDEERFLVPAGSAETELEEKRSRFVARAEPLSDPKKAKEIVAVRRAEHPSASHVAWAFVTGRPASEICGMSDDGEPKGTAGRPVMEVLKGSGVRDVILTVTRYFGGTKLGTGGLVRAYSEAARKVLEALQVKELVPVLPFTVRLRYDQYDQAKRILAGMDASVTDEEFTTEIVITGKIPSGYFDECRDALRNASSGGVELLKTIDNDSGA